MEDTDLHQAQVKMSNKYRDNPLMKKILMISSI